MPKLNAPKTAAKLAIKQDQETKSNQVSLAFSITTISFKNAIDKANAPPDKETNSLS